MLVPCELVTVVFVLMAFHHQVCAESVIGGREAAAHSRPYMALVEQDHGNGSKKEYCGGFLLSEEFVMTAAHCQAKFFTVRLGVHHVHQKEARQRIRVEQAFPHKYYNKTLYTNDVMILKLKSRAKFNDNVQPIALADWRNKSLPKSCSTAGWGRTKWKEGDMSDFLKEVNVTLVHNVLCDHQNVYCSDDRTGPGRGDSGGPLVCEDGEAFGVVSTCYKKPDSHLLCKYTKIENHKEWIAATIQEALSKV